MGGTKILAGVVNSTQGIVARYKKATPKIKKTDEYVDALSDAVEALLKSSSVSKNQIAAVCLGIPGSVNPLTGRIGLAPNLGLKNYFIKEKLEQKIKFPILIENDVNLGTLGVKYFGLGKKAKNLLAVFIGTGIGGAMIFNGKLFRGSSFTAGEIGHLVVQKNGPLCGCGKRGCFEAVASRTAIVRNIIKDIKSNKRSSLKQFVSSRQKIKSKVLSAAVKSNDKVAVKHVEEACETTGMVLANIANLLNIDTIVLGGGLIEALDHYMVPLIKKSFKKYVLKDTAKGLKIAASKLGDDAALFGGIPLAEEFLKIKV